MANDDRKLSTPILIVGAVAAAALVFAIVQTTKVGGLESRVDALVTEVEGLGSALSAAEKRANTHPTVTAPTVRGAQPATPGASADETQRIAALQRRVDTLEALARARANGDLAGTPAEAGGDVDEDVSALREDVDALLTGEGLRTEEGRAAVEKILEETREKRRAERAARRAERHEAAVDAVAERLGLNDAQREELHAIAANRRDLRENMRAAMESGEMTWPEARRQLIETREAQEQQARALLGDAGFEEVRDELGLNPVDGGRRGERGGRGGRGGGRGDR